MEQEILSAVAVLTLTATMLILKKKKKKQRNRRYWVRPWVARRKAKGIMNLVNNELLLEDPSAFENYVRMPNHLFLKLLSKVDKYIAKQDTVMRECIPSKHKLMITLRYLATGETFRNLMYSTRVHESTIAQFVPIVCTRIYCVLSNDYIKFPKNQHEWEKISEDFYTMWQMPNTLGALDGKHIAFSPSSEAGSTFYNYKGFHSIILLALTDAKYRFIYIDVGINGRVSDGGVFAQSTLFHSLKNNSINIPADRPLPGLEHPMPYVIIGDAAFPLKKYLLKSYPFRGLTQQQAIYNYRLSRARRVVENSFGILANRFRILRGTMNLHVEKVRNITLTCCALHNFLLYESNVHTNVPTEAPTVVNELPFIQLEQQGGNRPSATAMEVRETFKDYFNGVGAVEWQNNAIA